MQDYAYLDDLAVNYALMDMDPIAREKAYQELYQGTFEYLVKIVPLTAAGMEKVDIVAELSKKKIPKWIHRYTPTRKKFRNYISNHARLASQNVHRDNHELKPSRRAYDLFRAIQSDASSGMPLSEALEKHLYHSGAGLRLQRQVESLLQTNLDPLSISQPLNGRDDDGKKVSLEDTLVFNEPAFELQRTMVLEVDSLPPRFKKLLMQLNSGSNVQLHELSFERPMRLIDKLVVLDNAFRIAAKVCAA